MIFIPGGYTPPQKNTTQNAGRQRGGETIRCEYERDVGGPGKGGAQGKENAGVHDVGQVGQRDDYRADHEAHLNADGQPGDVRARVAALRLKRGRYGVGAEPHRQNEKRGHGNQHQVAPASRMLVGATFLKGSHGLDG